MLGKSSITKAYDPKKTENKIYQLWEKSGYFNPDKLPDRKKPFTIIMPPPNANGALHIGHAVFVTLQDIITRYKRMRGYKTLWLPGADHAGLETQVVYDKKLEKEGRSRFKIPRDELHNEMLEFTLRNKKIMENQLRELGASCDWSRKKFTLDKDVIKIVYETFQKLYDDGLCYRGERIINWCTKHQTALSELETKYMERKDSLYHIKYGPLTLATVRPETKFGDTAVAVNPKDKRYKNYIGREIEIETLIGKAKIKVIADDAVDMNFGTGVVKVTPAHDPNDFEIGKRHNLETREVIDKFGRLNEKAGKYAGLKVMEARKIIAEDMQKAGLLEKVDENYTHAVATCYKCGTTLEPRVMPQWFVRMTTAPHDQKAKSKKQKSGKSLRDMAVEAVKKGKIRFTAKKFEKIFFHWMKNLRDWNISRQIVWGIKIPVSYCLGCSEIIIKPKIKSHWFIVRHGETDWNKEKRWQGQLEPVSLNELGIQQAKEAALQLKNKNIDLIISSDLLRCKETAEIIAKELGVDELIFDKRLRERHGGIAHGTTPEERERKFGKEKIKLWRGYENRIPEGESWEEVEKRVWEAFTHHREKHKHKNIVIVTHGGPIRVLHKKIKNLSFDEIFRRTPQNTEIMNIAMGEKKCKKCGSHLQEEETDTFDTWFSSGQWPFAALLSQGGSKLKIKKQNAKLRNNIFNFTTKDFQEFYPTQVMETGHDILFFWVARMIMLGIYATGKPPFECVYLHGIVRDKERQKMSKSKGNVIDPLGVIELYGTDALRMALIVGNTPGSDVIISEEKIEGYKRFANKIWNAARFVLSNTEGFKIAAKPPLSPEDKKSLKELEELVEKITSDMENFKFYLAAEKLYHYFWHTFADKIIEETKARFQGKNANEQKSARYTLLKILKTSLILLHPFMPFITEEIWKMMKGKKTLLMIERWPKV